jgi:hypothetical protein
VADDDVAVLDWQSWVESCFDTWHYFGKWFGATWPSHGLPRGTPLLAIGCFQNFMESVGVEPRTSPLVKRFGSVWATTSPHGGSLLIYGFNYI